MLELIAILYLRRYLAGLAERRGHRRLWGLLGPLLWLGGEFAGAIFAVIVGLDGLPLYGMALAGAIGGGAASYLIVTLLPDRSGALAMAGATGSRPEDVKDNPFA